jgi:hypothetical protein
MRITNRILIALYRSVLLPVFSPFYYSVHFLITIIMRSTFTPTSENLYAYGHTRSSKFFGKSHVVQLLVLLCIQLCSQSLFSQVAPLPVERTFSSSPSKFNIDGYLQRQSAGAGDWLEGLA